MFLKMLWRFGIRALIGLSLTFGLFALAAHAESTGSSATPQATEHLPAGAWQRISAQIQAQQHHIRWTDQPTLEHLPGAYRALTPRQAMRTYFTDTGPQVVVEHRDQRYQLGLNATAIGYGTKLQALPQGERVAEGNRLEYRRGNVIEWYVNRVLGVEQGFTVAEPPGERGDEPLVVSMAVSGGFSAQLIDEDGLQFFKQGEAIFRYDGLKVWDADGTILDAELQVLTPQQIAIAVVDAEARYPVTIDPLIASEVAILRASNAGADAEFGYAVAISGDTIVVGANLADGTQTDGGEAYVFDRNAGGADNWCPYGSLA